MIQQPMCGYVSKKIDSTILKKLVYIHAEKYHVLVKNWNQPRRQSTGEWISRIEYYCVFNMQEPWQYHVRESKLITEKQHYRIPLLWGVESCQTQKHRAMCNDGRGRESSHEHSFISAEWKNAHKLFHSNKSKLITTKLHILKKDCKLCALCFVSQ